MLSVFGKSLVLMYNYLGNGLLQFTIRVEHTSGAKKFSFVEYKTLFRAVLHGDPPRAYLLQIQPCYFNTAP